VSSAIAVTVWGVRNSEFANDFIQVASGQLIPSLTRTNGQVDVQSRERMAAWQWFICA
jgi:hypothetical protein